MTRSMSRPAKVRTDALWYLRIIKFFWALKHT